MTRRNILIIILIIVAGFSYWYQSGMKEEVKSLSQETAESLIKDNWGECAEDICSTLIVNVFNREDGTWYVEAIYDEMRDDSVRTQKKTAPVYYLNGEWEIGIELIREYKCQPGRGQQEFSSELCI